MVCAFDRTRPVRRAAIQLAALATLLLTASSALAAPVNTNRPVEPVVGSEPTLQYLLDTLGTFDAVNDQTGVALFSPLSTTAQTTLLFEIAGHENINEFGIYGATDGEILDTAVIFAGSDSPQLTQEIIFNADGSVEIDEVVTDGFRDGFGFYLHNTRDGYTFFSEDSRNEFSHHDPKIHQPHALVYQDSSIGEYILAWEDLPGGGDRDFQDLIVHVSGVQPLVQAPEPASALLLGCGILILGARRIFRA